MSAEQQRGGSGRENRGRSSAIHLLRDILDLHVELQALSYGWAIRSFSQRNLTFNAAGELVGVETNLDRATLRLAFIAIARSFADPIPKNRDVERLWVPKAQVGIARMALREPWMGDLDMTNPFTSSKKNREEQKLIFRQVSELTTLTNPNLAPLQRAVGVAIGEIALREPGTEVGGQPNFFRLETPLETSALQQLAQAS